MKYYRKKTSCNNFKNRNNYRFGVKRMIHRPDSASQWPIVTLPDVLHYARRVTYQLKSTTIFHYSDHPLLVRVVSKPSNWAINSPCIENMSVIRYANREIIICDVKIKDVAKYGGRIYRILRRHTNVSHK